MRHTFTINTLSIVKTATAVAASLTAPLCAVVLLAGCDKEKNFSKEKGSEEGTLSLSSFSLEESQEVLTKASAAGGNYVITILDSDGKAVMSTTYSEVKAADGKISLTAGNYTLQARSTGDAIEPAAFEQPVYGAETDFVITAGQTTAIGALTCTLLQCKVTVSYSDDFLKMVTGDCSATVSVTAGYPLVYGVTYSGGSASYNQSAGYFAINNGANTTMEVVFKGSIEGKSQKMTKTFTGIAAKQWRQVKFIKKADEQGNATFDIEINAFVDDEDLTLSVDANKESIIGDDPSAPKGDGGIALDFDYAHGCDTQFTDLLNMVVPTMDERAMKLVVKVSVPNGVKKFSVIIESSNSNFVNAVAAAEASTLDLIYPSAANMMIFDVVPFPHGEELLNKTELTLDLSAAQEAILNFAGTHTFTMVVTDLKGCKNSIPVKMIVR